ncbi:hypothetical protein BKP45_05420 [Anaerobacillus alkalidiazotrophicus]|uniref:DUF3679 domain-containing protein n=1 Tax=Anaerobacillus alkalidiazotrophicus TaxID=472963 RepID=A0A1S2MC16_9BACI|nr:DUF3679 domain-containing protein [Anaerobacillus alkalidiazotrophicus]OIJ22114.1 hypothetical protein BKP45_05420 [Anaerobacillus alkalidiazotrophicus]
MTKFLLKCFFITTVLFGGVLVGIQIASNNMIQMTGDSKYSTTNIIKKSDSNETPTVYTDLTTEKVTSHDLESKQEKLEQIQTFNLFSQMGVRLSDILNKLFSSILSQLTAAIGNVLT